MNPSRNFSDCAFKITQEPDVDATGIWILPYAIGGTRLDQIDANGLTDYRDGISPFFFMEDAPFGGRLGFRLLHSNVIPMPAIKYYRFQYRYGNDPNEYWHDFDAPVYVRYVKRVLNFPPTFPKYFLGPHADIVPGKNLYEFRPHEEDLHSLVGAYFWEDVSWPTMGFLENLYSGFLDTDSLSLAPGKYRIKLEVYDQDGNQVIPGLGTFDFVVPDGVDPNDDTILTDYANPMDINSGGFVFTINIDNRHCNAEIFEPTIGTVGAGECGFLRYDPNDPNTAVSISYNATHPGDFALFSFTLVRGPNQVNIATVRGFEVSALSAGPYIGDGSGSFEHTFLVTDLLGPCPLEAAFSENLAVYTKATNGWHQRLTQYDDYAVRAFAITPE